MAKLVIFGIGDAACLAHLYFTEDTNHQVVAFTVDRNFLSHTNFLGLPVVAFEEVANFYPPSEHQLFVAIGYRNVNQARTDAYFRVKKSGYTLASYISTRAIFLTETRPGDNCFILEGSIIQPYVSIGNNVTVWSGSHIGHHSVVEDHCFLAPRVAICGRARIGHSSFIGANATIRNSISIAPCSLVGAGAIITRDTSSHGAYVPNRTIAVAKPSSEFDI